jgi:F0F1-type ATP synthase membrane subunit b/b'
VVLFILVSKAGPLVSKGLIDRRDDLQRDIEAAAKAKAEAKARYEEQKERLSHIEEEVARIRADYSEQGKHDIERIERESKERHERFVRESRTLIEQEGRALHQRMFQETVAAVTTSAEETLTRQVSANDQERLANEYLSQLDGLSAKRGAA